MCPYKQCLLTSFERDKNMNRAEVKKQQDVLTCGYALSTPVILPNLRREAHWPSREPGRMDQGKHSVLGAKTSGCKF